MARLTSELREEIRFRVLRILDENPEISTRALAREVGISNGSAYYCVSAMVNRGLVKLDNFSRSSNKGRYAYILTPKGMAEKAALTSRFLARKIREYEALKQEIENLSAELYAVGADAPGLPDRTDPANSQPDQAPHDQGQKERDEV